MAEPQPASKDQKPRAEVRFFFFVLVCAFLGFLYVLSSFVADLVLGFLIAGASRPLFLRLRARLRGRDGIAAVLVTVLVAVFVSVPLVYLVTALSTQAGRAYDAVIVALSEGGVEAALEPDGWFGARAAPVARWLGVPYSADSVKALLSDGAGKAAAVLTPQLNALISNLFSLLYHFTLMLIVVFYGLLDGPAVKRRVFELSPLPDDEEERIVQKFNDVWSAVLVGNGIGSLLQGMIGGLAMWACGLPSPLLWGVIMTVFAFLPLAGISVVVVPATLYLLAVDRWLAGLLFFAFCTTQGLLIENVVKTKLIGDRMKMHSLLIFLAVLGGISMFGIVGLLYGPLIATFFLTVLDLYDRMYRSRLFPGAAEVVRAASAPGKPS